MTIGRDRELSLLHEVFRSASRGHRQIALIAGEPGAGKSSLVKAFLQSMSASEPGVRIGWGRCVEQFGGREPYVAVLEALERIGRGPAVESLAAALRAAAPSWLAQMASLQSADDTERLALTLPGIAPHRMLREFASLVEVFSADEPLLIVLEDLQWSDFGTVDLLSVLAQRPEPARIMVVGTYRPAEAAVLSHPIAQIAASSQARDVWTPIVLEGLSRTDVGRYLHRRLGGLHVDEDVSTLVHNQTDGNPLFVVALVDHLIASGYLIDQGGRWSVAEAHGDAPLDVPHSLRRMLEEQLRLTTASDREVLDVASVAGEAFDVREVAAGLEQPVEHVEARCDWMCRVHNLLRPLGARGWADGSVGGGYVFAHGAYQRLLYDVLPPARRAILHQRIGERIETGYARRTNDVAAELGHHFQRGTERWRAVVYLAACARAAYARRACEDAVACLEQALRLIDEAPPSADMARQELHLRQLYGVVLSETQKYETERLRENLTRALALAEDAGDAAARFDVQYALVLFHKNQGDYTKAAEICRPLLEPSDHVVIPAYWRAEYAYGVIALWRGDLGSAEQHLVRVRSAAPVIAGATPWFGVDPVVGAASHDSLRLWMVGHAAEARVQQREAILLAERLGHPFTTAQALTIGASALALGGHWTEADQAASRAIALAAEDGFPRWLGMAQVVRGRALAERGHAQAALAQVRGGLEIVRQAGLQLGGSLLFAFQAGACLRLDQWEEGLKAVDDGLAVCEARAERFFEAELWRLKGELLMGRASGERQQQRRAAFLDEACASIGQALGLARSQGARAVERRVRQTAARLPETKGLPPAA